MLNNQLLTSPDIAVYTQSLDARDHPIISSPSPYHFLRMVNFSLYCDLIDDNDTML